MIKTLMDIPDVVMERTSKNGWQLAYSGYKGMFYPHNEQAGMLFIELDHFSPPFTLVEQWQYQLSRGEFAANMGLVSRDDRWWLAQCFVGKDTLAEGAELQIQLAACLHAMSKREGINTFSVGRIA